MDRVQHQQAGWLLGDLVHLAMGWNASPPGGPGRQARANAIANLVTDSIGLIETVKTHHLGLEEAAELALTPLPGGDDTETGPGLEKP